jgi:hypothetical protein
MKVLNFAGTQATQHIMSPAARSRSLVSPTHNSVANDDSNKDKKIQKKPTPPVPATLSPIHAELIMSDIHQLKTFSNPI